MIILLFVLLLLVLLLSSVLINDLIQEETETHDGYLDILSTAFIQVLIFFHQLLCNL